MEMQKGKDNIFIALAVITMSEEDKSGEKDNSEYRCLLLKKSLSMHFLRSLFSERFLLDCEG